MTRSTRTLRTELPTAVWERLAAEAAAHDMPIGRFARHLIVARDRRKFPETISPDTPGATPSTGPTESESDPT